MNFETEEINSSIEQLLITRLIVSEKFCKDIIPHIDPVLLKTNVSRTICEWCIDYYEKYQTCPGKNIQSIFEEKEKSVNVDEYEIIEETLSHVSEDYQVDEHFNENYAIDQCFTYLKKQKVHFLKDDITNALDDGQLDDAERAIEKYNSIKRIDIDKTNVLKDFKAIDSAINIEEERLFKFPGVLGNFLKSFNAGDLISFQAPAKKGKTWWLIESCSKALLTGLNVVFVSLEMPKAQVLRRIYQNLCAGKILKYDDETLDIKLPKFTKLGNRYQIKPLNKKARELTTTLVKKKMKSISKMARGGGLRLITAPAKSIDVKGIKEQMDNLVVYDGFVPNVIVIDYADIIASSKGLKDQRSQIDDVWSSLRGLAQEKNCLTITATHTNRSTFNKDSGVADVTEDIRKVNHVSMMIALNQNSANKEAGAMRIKKVADRHNEFLENEEVVVLQNLNIGKPYLDSKWLRDVVLDEDEREE